MPSVIARFREAIRYGDPLHNADLFADDVRLHGVRWTPFEGKDEVLAVFAMLQEVIDDLEYVAEYEGRDGVVLLARGRVGGRAFDGVQVLRFNAHGLIDECRDLIRPHSAGSALLEASDEYLERHGGGTPSA